MKQCFIVLIGVMLAVVLVGGQTGNDLFSKALSKERVDGQLEEAIALYERVVKEFAADRALAAKALLQMGRCYERLGKADAQQAYERLLREFADQRGSADEARSRLAALARPAAGGVTAERVWWGRDVDIQGQVSRDGRYLSYSDPATGNLAVRDLQTGRNTTLTIGDAPQPWVQFAQRSAIAADSRQIAYAWFNQDQFYELRVTRIDRPPARVIFRNREFAYLEPFDWTPDGRFIATAMQAPDGTASIAMISVRDGSLRVLKSIDWRWPSGMSLSPDGRYLAYGLLPKDGGTKHDLFALATDGTREMALVEHPADDTCPVWTPDGAGVVFLSDRSGAVDVWFTRVVAGQSQGAPALVKRDFGRGIPLGFTRDGSLYAAMIARSLDVYVGEIDLAAGRATAASAPLSQRFVGTNFAPDWSPDGLKLSYESKRGVGGPGASVIVIHALEDGSERELLPAVQYFHRPRWSPDGGALTIDGRGLRAPYGVFTVDHASGRTEHIVKTEAPVTAAHVVWSRDGRTLYYAAHAPKYDAIMAFDRASGTEREIARTGTGEIAVSPDGERLAFWWGDGTGKVSSIRLIPTRGGEPRDLLTLRAPAAVSYFGGLSWTPDGRRLLFVKDPGERANRELWQVDVASGEASSMGLSAQGLQYVRLHPDARRIAYSAGTREAEVWVLERFLPPPVRSPTTPPRR